MQPEGGTGDELLVLFRGSAGEIKLDSRRSVVAHSDSDPWSVGQWFENGQPHIVRMRGKLPAPVDRELLPHLIVIRWRYETDDSGMPGKAEHEQMQSFEDALEAGPEAKTPTLQALSLTGGGMKEWRYYTADVQRFMASLNRDLEGHPKYPIEFTLYQDPEWNALTEYLNGAQPAA